MKYSYSQSICAQEIRKNGSSPVKASPYDRSTLLKVLESIRDHSSEYSRKYPDYLISSPNIGSKFDKIEATIPAGKDNGTLANILRSIKWSDLGK